MFFMRKQESRYCSDLQKIGRKLTLAFALSLSSGLTFTLGVAPEARADLADRRKHELKQAEISFGPMIEREKAPALYEALQIVFDRLSKAQQQLMPGNLWVSNKVYILDSPEENAAVVPLKEPGVHQAENIALVTTGVIRKMFTRESGTGLKNGMTRIAGLLAHELAHPLDKYDEEGEEHERGRLRSAQAREIRADTEGSLIAKRAGYPADSVYQALLRLFENTPVKESVIGSAVRTHPQEDLRLITQEIFMTLSRYENGLAEPVYPEPVKLALFKDLEKLQLEARESRKFKVPTSLEETLSRLTEMVDPKQEGPKDRIEFNRLLLTMDKQLIRKGLALTEAEKTAVYGFLGQWIERSNVSDQGPPQVMSRNEIRRWLTADTGSEAFLDSPAHDELLAKIPLFQTNDHKKWIKQEVLDCWRHSDTLFDEIARLRNVLPAERMFSEYHEELRRALTRDLDAGPGRFGRKALEAEAKFSSELKIQLAHWIHVRALPDVSRSYQAQAFLLASDQAPQRVDGDAFSILLQKVKPGSRMSRSRNRDEKAMILLDPAHLKTREAYLETIRHYWENRRLYGTLELLRGNHWEVPWDEIMSDLKIDRKTGRSQLVSAVKKFCQSEEYVQLIKDLYKQEGVHELRNEYVRAGQPEWVSDDLEPYLSGDRNPAIRQDDSLKHQATELFVTSYFAENEARYRAMYRSKLKAYLNTPRDEPLTLFDLENFQHHVNFQRGNEFSARAVDITVTTIERARLSEQDKLALLKKILIPEAKPERWPSGAKSRLSQMSWISQDRAIRQPIMELLKKRNLVESPIALLKLILSDPGSREAWKKGKEYKYSDFLSRWSEALAADLRQEVVKLPQEQRKAHVIHFARNYLNIGVLPKGGDAVESANSSSIRALKNELISLTQGIPLSGAEAREFLNLLTHTGPSSGTDQFLLEHFSDHLPPTDGEKTQPAPLTQDRRNWITLLLEQKRIHSDALRLRLARRILEPEIQRTRSSAPREREQAVADIVERLNQYVPGGSAAKDQFLEEIAWRMELRGPALGALIEDSKSLNWRKADPLLVNAGSSFAEYVSKLGLGEREKLIEYLKAPEGKNLPESFVKQIEEEAFRTGMQAVPVTAANNPIAQERVRRGAGETSRRLAMKLETLIMDGKPVDRVPLFSLVMGAGQASLTKQPGFPGNVIHKFLGFSPGSMEELFLSSFLEVIPEHERTVTLAYMLSQTGQDKSSIKSMFEVFQTVGIKIGQLSAVWKLFGENVARATRDLKENAKPMTLAEVEKVLNAELTPEERKKIKRLVEVVGSASIKTVVAAELEDGRNVVILVQRPNTLEQITTNLRLVKQFIERLKEKKVPIPLAALDSVVKDVEAQLKDELKFKREADKIRIAKEYFESLNSKWKDRLNGHRFEVPALEPDFQVHDHVMFQKRIGGLSWDHLSPEMKKQLGPQLVEASLNWLFQFGVLDADRHGGNVVVDQANKVIYMLDFGQETQFSRNRAPWSGDDIYYFSQFLKGIKEGDAEAIIKFGLQMTDKKDAPETTLEALASKLRGLFKDPSAASPMERIIGTVNIFAEAGFDFASRFSAGALKGLKTLQAEDYVSAEAFEALVTRKVTAVLARKAPRAALDWISATRKQDKKTSGNDKLPEADQKPELREIPAARQAPRKAALNKHLQEGIESARTGAKTSGIDLFATSMNAITQGSTEPFIGYVEPGVQFDLGGTVPYVFTTLDLLSRSIKHMGFSSIEKFLVRLQDKIRFQIVSPEAMERIRMEKGLVPVIALKAGLDTVTFLAPALGIRGTAKLAGKRAMAKLLKSGNATIGNLSLLKQARAQAMSGAASLTGAAFAAIGGDAAAARRTEKTIQALEAINSAPKTQSVVDCASGLTRELALGPSREVQYTALSDVAWDVFAEASKGALFAYARIPGAGKLNNAFGPAMAAAAASSAYFLRLRFSTQRIRAITSEIEASACDRVDLVSGRAGDATSEVESESLCSVYRLIKAFQKAEQEGRSTPSQEDMGRVYACYGSKRDYVNRRFYSTCQKGVEDPRRYEAMLYLKSRCGSQLEKCTGTGPADRRQPFIRHLKAQFRLTDADIHFLFNRKSAPLGLDVSPTAVNELSCRRQPELCSSGYSRSNAYYTLGLSRAIERTLPGFATSHPDQARALQDILYAMLIQADRGAPFTLSQRSNEEMHLLNQRLRADTATRDCAPVSSENSEISRTGTDQPAPGITERVEATTARVSGIHPR